MSDSVLAILAGGSSRRFQVGNKQWQDKALLEMNGAPLLIHLLNNSSMYYSDISISVNTKNRRKKYSDIIVNHLISEMPNFIIDYQNSQFQGVFLGIYSVLRSLPNRNIQFIPSDRPYLNFLILNKLKTVRFGVSILRYENGMIEPLLSLYGSDMYFPKEFEQLPLTRADALIRVAQHLQIYNITSILEENNLPSYIFDNINIQEDYTSVRKRTYDIENIQIPDPIKIKRNKIPILDSSTDINDFLWNLIEEKYFYLAFLWSRYFRRKLSEHDFREIEIACLRRESVYWLDSNMPFLALHALQDLVNFYPEEETVKTSKKITELKTKIRIKSKKV